MYIIIENSNDIYSSSCGYISINYIGDNKIKIINI